MALGVFAAHEAFVSAITRRIARLAPVRRVLPPPASTSTRTAAVLCPLIVRRGEVHVLFTLRSGKVGTHANQVSFPGGHMHPGETAEEAALRESVEELGEGMAGSLTLGRYHDTIAVTGTHVTPVIGIVREDMTNLSHLTPSEDEVADVFSLSLESLVSDECASVEYIPPHAGSNHPRHGGIYAPVFEGGPERVWGLTAFMTYGILRDVLLPAASESGMNLPPFTLAADERLHRLVPLPRFEQAGGARREGGGDARMSVPATISSSISDKAGVAAVVASTTPAQPS